MTVALPSGTNAPDPRSSLLGNPELGASLRRFVRGKAPLNEVDDIVQATLTDALAAEQAPSDEKELERWVFGIARNKVVDYYRRHQREAPREPMLAEEIAAESAPLSARELLRWAEKELPDASAARSTLEWMLREGAGERLEEIASEEKLPAPRVRQRVARLRRHFRERWAAAVAAVAVLSLLLLGTAIWWRRHTAATVPDDIAREPNAPSSPERRGDDIRRLALQDCAKEQWRACLDGLDRARAVDAQGDAAEVIQNARAAAERGLSPPALSSEPAPLPEKRTPGPKAPPVQGKRAAPPPVDSMTNAPLQKRAKEMPEQIPQAPIETAPPVRQKKPAPAKSKADFGIHDFDDAKK